MKTVVFKCGCEYKPSDVYRDKHSFTVYCPVCKERIDYCKIVCLDCGEIFIVNKKGLRAVRCITCRKKRAGKIRIDRAEHNILKGLSSKTPILDSHYNMTHKEIGNILGLTRQRVAKIEQDALEKIRNKIHRYPALIEKLIEIEGKTKVFDMVLKERSPIDEKKY